MGLRKPADPRKRKSYRGQEIPAFCLNMQARRIELMLTQEELGRLINAPKTRISEIESGRFPSDPERIISIAKALECSVDWLLGVDSVTSPPP